MTPEQYDVPHTKLLSLTETYMYGCRGAPRLPFRSPALHRVAELSAGRVRSLCERNTAPAALFTFLPISGPSFLHLNKKILVYPFLIFCYDKI